MSQVLAVYAGKAFNGESYNDVINCSRVGANTCGVGVAIRYAVCVLNGIQQG